MTKTITIKYTIDFNGPFWNNIASGSTIAHRQVDEYVCKSEELALTVLEDDVLDLFRDTADRIIDKVTPELVKREWRENISDKRLEEICEYYNHRKEVYDKLKKFILANDTAAMYIITLENKHMSFTTMDNDDMHDKSKNYGCIEINIEMI